MQQCPGTHQSYIWVASSTEASGDLGANLQLVLAVQRGGGQGLQVSSG